MSNQPPSPTEEPESSQPAPTGSERKESAPAINPRKAILNAAIVCLEYAKQYLDKFTYWPDYILATHYHANVLSLTDKPENWRDAEKYFKDVESWFEPGRLYDAKEQARRRIRAEAMYNRAVLLSRRGETLAAREQFDAVTKLIETEKEDTPMKGILFATNFALLMLIARQLGFVEKTSGGKPNSSEETKTGSELRSEWNARMTPFLTICDREIKRLEQSRANAEREVKGNAGWQDSRQGGSSPTSTTGGHQGSPPGAYKMPLQTEKHDDPSARITRASKDLAILRMMVEQVNDVEGALNRNNTI